MKIRSQIILAKVPTVILLICIVILFIFTLNSIEYQAHSILANNFTNILAVRRVNESLEELNRYVEKNPEKDFDKIKKIKNEVEKDIVFLERESLENKEEKELRESLRNHWTSYKEDIAILPFNINTEEDYKKVQQAIKDILLFNQDAIVRKKDNFFNFIADSRLLITAASILSLIFGFFMFWLFTGIFLAPLNKMIEIVSSVGKTKKTTLLSIKGSEEIEKLSKEFNLMTTRLEDFHQSSLGRAVNDYENLKATFDALPYPFLIFSPEDDIIFMNKTALALFKPMQDKGRKHPSVFYIKNTLKVSLLKITTQVKRSKQPYFPTKTEEPISIFDHKKKSIYLPFAFPIKNRTTDSPSGDVKVVMILQDMQRLLAADRKTEEIFMNFVHDIQAPLSEIQMALYTSLQEETGPLTEKQKDILYVARDNAEDLKNLYLVFLKISGFHKKNE